MKTCIFCGNKPESKTKEHVVPKWLIEMTGDPNRTTVFGKYRDTLRKYSWKNFTFPACETCNNEYSTLESRAKLVVVKLLAKTETNEIEQNDLLDWLDKIRIGLWLGHIQLNREYNFKPNFYIKQRLGLSDRFAAIYYLNDNQLGITYTGTEFPAFKIAPSCFTIFINNIAIFNFSNEFAFGRRLGLAFPNKKQFIPNDSLLKIDYFNAGIERIMRPIIKKSILANSLRIYQAIIKPESDENIHEFETDYHKKYLKNSKSKIFFENDFTRENGFINDTIKIGKTNNFERNIFKTKIAIQTLTFQNYCFQELSPSVELLEKNEQKKINNMKKEIINFNNRYIISLQKNNINNPILLLMTLYYFLY